MHVNNPASDTCTSVMLRQHSPSRDVLTLYLPLYVWQQKSKTQLVMVTVWPKTRPGQLKPGSIDLKCGPTRPAVWTGPARPGPRPDPARPVYGRLFVKTVRPIRYWTVVLSVCLSCLSVTLMYCGQTVGWIKMPLGMRVGIGPSDIVLDGDPSPLPKKGRAPNLQPVSTIAKRLDGSRWNLACR